MAQGEGAQAVPLLPRALIPTTRAHPHGLTNPNHLPKALLANTIPQRRQPASTALMHMLWTQAPFSSTSGRVCSWC